MTDNTFDALVDLSHHDDLRLDDIKEAGISAVIHKLTQDISFVDDQYAKRSLDAQRLGLLWGCYHFLSGSDTKQQFAFWLSKMEKLTAKGLKVLPCLDWEPDTTPGQTTASFEQLIDVVEQYHSHFQTYPAVYGGYWMIEQLKDKKSEILGACPLWQGFYRSPIEIPTTIWDTWAIWQYTDGSEAKGLFKNVDRDRFNGTSDDLSAFWAKYAVSF